MSSARGRTQSRPSLRSSSLSETACTWAPPTRVGNRTCNTGEGPKGFIKVMDEHTLALADFAGNAQYISLGNLTENSKAFMFLMDYRSERSSDDGECAPRELLTHTR